MIPIDNSSYAWSGYAIPCKHANLHKYLYMCMHITLVSVFVAVISNHGQSQLLGKGVYLAYVSAAYASISLSSLKEVLTRTQVGQEHERSK